MYTWVPENENEEPPPPYTSTDEEYWRIVPTGHEIWTYYIHEVGFVAGKGDDDVFVCLALELFHPGFGFVEGALRKDVSAGWR